MEESTQEEIKAPLLHSHPQHDLNRPSSSTQSKPEIEDEPSEEENSPVKQVALTVPVTDDPTIPVLTFRMWVLGALSCAVLSFLNQFFWYRTEPLSITAISAQVAVVPLGQLMAAKLPDRVLFKGTRFEFSLNPGPFNVKEHVLITIFANAGAGSVYAIHIVTVVKIFYKKHITFFVSLIVCITTQVLGFGWAGIFRRYLVEPAEMWWPANLVQVSLFRALHEKEERPKGGLTRIQFFLIAFICSFTYYVYPGYLFEMLTSLSWVCWAFPTSVLANQLGSGLNGLGIAALGIDWSTISAYLGSPLASPWFATANVAAGFLLVMYVLTPVCYWLNVYKAKTFPIFSDDLFTSSGLVYNISAIVDSDFHLDEAAYEREGRLYLSTFFAMTYGVGFAALTATIVHVMLFHGREIWEQSKTPGLNIITEYVIGYIYPGYPVANMCFKVYGYISMTQAVTFLQDFKLGHYMKIPPRTMYMAQIVGTLIASLVYLGTAWWLMETIDGICTKSSSVWTCPSDTVFYDASVIWGLIGPRRIFGDEGVYTAVNWFFLAGAVAPLLVWAAAKAFPDQEWIRLINMPVLIGATGMMPPATAVNYTTWVIVGFLSGFVAYRYAPEWWKRHNYLLSGALDAGLAFMGVALYLCLGYEDISLSWWGNDLDGCDLAWCPTVKQVAMTVPITDDSTLPVLTFRMWVLGALSCAVLSFLNQFFWYRREPLSITAISAQIAVVPLGQLMASNLPDRLFFKGTRFEFSLNPGPFNVKEHVLITIFANAGAGSVYAIHIVTVVKMFYKKNITFLVSFIVCITTQVLGFGWAGIFRRYLVQPAEMWWPANLVQVSLFRALHEKEERPKGGLTRIQFFLIAFVCSFSYYVFPGYLFEMLISLSWLCWAFPTSVFASQLGSGLNGLGIAAIGLDWSTISAYLDSPLASPWFATANVAAGFILVMYVLTPICYWLDVYKAKTFPIVSDDLFTSTGLVYNISAIVDSNFHLDEAAYQKEGHLHLSTFFALTYGAGFAALTATIVHVILFHGREIWEQSKTSFKERKMDIHTKLMRQYKEVPEWWFWAILVVNIAFTVFVCEYYNSQLQLPWWGVLLACSIAFIFTLPIGIITAITNQRPGLNIITEYVIGYIYPGYPVANMCFKVFGFISMKQAIIFLQDFKLGHYMKIPPRTMFMAQIIGTLIASLVYLCTAWWLMETVDNICTKSSTSVWTCPSDTVFYDASVIWGLIGPRRIFGNEGVYGAINWFFLGGAVAPVFVWAATKAFPNQHWIRLINMPVLIGATREMPPARAINYTAWIVTGFLSGFVAFRYAPGWWKRHNYLLSGALDAGVAFMAVALYLCLEYGGVSLSWWGNKIDGCDLASCTIAI